MKVRKLIVLWVFLKWKLFFYSVLNPIAILILAGTLGPVGLLGAVSSADSSSLTAKSVNEAPNSNVSQFCYKSLKLFPGSYIDIELKKACENVKIFNKCQSVNQQPIFHFEKFSSDQKAQKILVFSMIHGDEIPAGTVGRYWILRLQGLNTRNHWRVVPLLNPDGWNYKTRTNANKVDLNRNFPTKDWKDKAIAFWHKEKSNPRRFPGNKEASEPETQCALQHLEDFKPDFVVSIHTPLMVLDFDGPEKLRAPSYSYLPWKSLGHFPGSLGRFLWFERRIPVLTMELKEDVPSSEKPLDQLQDIIGYLVSKELLDCPQCKKPPVKAERI